MKFFKIHRKFDESKVSGTGHVVDGVVFRDGTTIIQWLTEMSSIAIYKSFEEFKAIHIDSHPLNETIVEMMEIQELEKKLEAIKALAPDLIGWISDGSSCVLSESTMGLEAEEEERQKVKELLKSFKSLLGIPDCEEGS